MEFEKSMLKVPLDNLQRDLKASAKIVDKEVATLAKALDALAKKTDTNESTTVTSLDKVIGRLKDLKNKLGESALSERASMDVLSDRVRFLEDGLTYHVLFRNNQDLSKYLQLRGRPLDAGNLPDYSARRQHLQHQRVNRVMVEYLLRKGYFDTATRLASESSISSLVDMDAFMASQRVISELRSGSCDAALEWAIEHRPRLKQANSVLEFQLRLQQFIELAKSNQVDQAVTHARENLMPFADTQMPAIQSALGLLPYSRKLADPDSSQAFLSSSSAVQRYAALVSPARWEYLVELFDRDHCALLSLSATSPFETLMTAGLASLKTPKCYSTDDKNPNCPICSSGLSAMAQTVPQPRHNHSVLVCRISGTIMDEHNPPLVLPNGQVYSTQALQAMASRNNGKIRDPFTGDQFDLEHTKKLFIT
jgi:macrophage erythroblast attacher